MVSQGEPDSGNGDSKGRTSRYARIVAGKVGVKGIKLTDFLAIILGLQ